MAGRHTDMSQHIGNTYNYLQVLSIETDTYVYNSKSIKRTFFNCICTCGNTKKILAGNVLSSSVKSCGCKKYQLLHAANKLHFENNSNKSVEKRMYSNYKCHGKDFELSFEEFTSLVSQDCKYCGTKPEQDRFSKNRKLSLKLNGIDRVDSSIGYTLDNCVPCCSTCNGMKSDLPVGQFLTHINKIFKHNK
jgi:hypothetical protein